MKDAVIASSVRTAVGKAAEARCAPPARTTLPLRYRRSLGPRARP